MRVLSLSLSLSCSFLRYERFFSWWIRVRVCHVTKRIHSSVPYRIPYVKWRWEKKEQAGITVRGSKERERPRSKRRRRIAGRNVAVKQFVECPVISGEQQSGLLRNSDGGKAWGFLLQLIAARLRPSVRSFVHSPVAYFELAIADFASYWRLNSAHVVDQWSYNSQGRFFFLFTALL